MDSAGGDRAEHRLTHRARGGSGGRGRHHGRRCATECRGRADFRCDARTAADFPRWSPTPASTATAHWSGSSASPRTSGTALRPLLERSTDAALILRSDAVVTYASPAVRQLFGWQDDAIIGSPITDLLHPDDRIALGSFLQTAAGPARRASAARTATPPRRRLDLGRGRADQSARRPGGAGRGLQPAPQHSAHRAGRSGRPGPSSFRRRWNPG